MGTLRIYDFSAIAYIVGHMKTLESKVSRGMTPATDNNQVEKHIALPKMNIGTAEVNIIGVTPLIVLRFSEKARTMMLEKQTGEAKAGREKKDPLGLFKESAYRDENDFLFPTICFKAAGVNSSNDIDLKQTEMRRAFHIRGEFVKLVCPPLKGPISEWDRKFADKLKWEHERGCSMRCDPVRNASGVADLRFRSFFPEWQTTLTIDFNESIISLEQLLMLLTVAGFGGGVGEWRPASKESKTGTFGRFRVG